MRAGTPARQPVYYPMKQMPVMGTLGLEPGAISGQFKLAFDRTARIAKRQRELAEQPESRERQKHGGECQGLVGAFCRLVGLRGSYLGGRRGDGVGGGGAHRVACLSILLTLLTVRSRGRFLFFLAEIHGCET